MGVIQLNKAEQMLAINIALDRTQNARKIGVSNAKMGGQPDWLTDLDGIGGEIAAARYFGVYPDTDINAKFASYDIRTRQGARVDVKTTKYPTGKLLATLKKQVGDCDIYLLVVGEFPEYRMAGYAKSEDLLKEENLIDLGHGKGYGLSQDQLTPIG